MSSGQLALICGAKTLDEWPAVVFAFEFGLQTHNKITRRVSQVLINKP